MIILKIWFTGELEILISEMDFPENSDNWNWTPIKWDNEVLPCIGDEFNWLTFVNTENFSIELMSKLEDISSNSVIVNRFWSRENFGTLCALTIDINKQSN
jgi:hypothetical protein